MRKGLKTQKMWLEKEKTNEQKPRNEDRRTGLERRRFSYTDHVPDKRSGLDRRKMVGG
ncbi:MAG: hypothetical protein JRF72_14870 [Deltaproteobacteria bacterium]|jgi:hypothetical protein|nr:hypothetical protein [Deltaproteobacteria bacterium]